jgi:hypothetical protein
VVVEQPADQVAAAVHLKLASRLAFSSPMAAATANAMPVPGHPRTATAIPRRVKPKASAEWTFAATVFNLFKAISTGHLTQSSLAALAS